MSTLEKSAGMALRNAAEILAVMGRLDEVIEEAPGDSPRER